MCKKMLRIFLYIKQLLGISVMLLLANTLYAYAVEDLNPYIGVDYDEFWMRGQGDWKRVLPRVYPGAVVYLGTKVTDCWGLELGYDGSVRAEKKWALASNTSFFSGTIGPRGLSGSTKLSRVSGHLDLIGFLPITDCFDFFASVGYGLMRTQIRMTFSETVGATAQSSALASVAGRARSVIRLGLGTSYMVTELVGIRARFRWESSSTLRVRGNQAFSNLGFQPKAFKDATVLSVGAFVKF